MATPERKPAFDLEAEVESAPQPQIPPRQTTNDATKHSPDPLQRQAWDLLKEMTDAFRERQQFGSGGGTRSPSGVAVERIKLLANFFNTIAAGLLTAGLIGPMAAYLYGFASPSRSPLEVVEGATIVFLLAILSHLAGRAVLGRLAR
ncbi:MAG: hypothetical protein U1E28_22480 [Beijerinckiaceae bacterium]